MLLEKQGRKYNLLFYGVAEERAENVFEKVRQLCTDDLGLDSEKVNNTEVMKDRDDMWVKRDFDRAYQSLSLYI